MSNDIARLVIEDLIRKLLNYPNKYYVLVHPSDEKFTQCLLLRDIAKVLSEAIHEIDQLEKQEDNAQAEPEQEIIDEEVPLTDDDDDGYIY